MHYLIIATMLAAALALPAAAQTGGAVVGKAPGVVGVARTVKASATITAIDPATRTIVMKGPQGKELATVAGDEVRNFAQLKVGDTVEVQYAEALVLELKKGGGMPVARTEKEAAGRAPQGGTPGAAAGRSVSVVGDVVNVDAATATVTVRGPKRTIEMHVRDPEQLKLIKTGDQIEATYTEAVAVSVTPKK